MTARFNPPPGWPTPPDGWIPDESWTPDPRWPAMPADWQLWVDDENSGPTEHTMLLPVAGPAGDPSSTTRPKGRARRLVLVASLCLAFLVVGLLLGNGGRGAQLAAAESALAEMEKERDHLEQDEAALVAKQGDLTATEAAVVERESAVGTKEAELVTRESAAATAEADLQARLAAVEGRETTVAAAEADLEARRAANGQSGAAANTPVQPTPDAPAGIVGGGGAVSYANCDAVRAAGKDPIRVGEPGYSSKLDRDGDGVGCE